MINYNLSQSELARLSKSSFIWFDKQYPNNSQYPSISKISKFVDIVLNAEYVGITTIQFKNENHKLISLLKF